jgi:anti-sigma-K factor RskA
MTTPDAFLHSDAAYILGALSDTERRAFEEHLRTCAECRKRVEEMRPVASLLADLTADDLADPLPSDSRVPDTLLPRLLREVSRRRRRRWITAGIGSLTAAAVAIVLVLSTTSGDSGKPVPAVAMTALTPSSLHATAAVSQLSWGTRIALACDYDSSYPTNAEYTLVVTDRSGTTHESGSWHVIPGKVVHYTGGTAVARKDIKSIAITVGGTPILELNL